MPQLKLKCARALCKMVRANGDTAAETLHMLAFGRNTDTPHLMVYAWAAMRYNMESIVLSDVRLSRRSFYVCVCM